MPKKYVKIPEDQKKKRGPKVKNYSHLKPQIEEMLKKGLKKYVIAKNLNISQYYLRKIMR